MRMEKRKLTIVLITIVTLVLLGTIASSYKETANYNKFYEDCADITEWTLEQEVNPWDVAADDCRGRDLDGTANMTSPYLNLTGLTNVSLTFNARTVELDNPQGEFFRVYAVNDTNEVLLLELQGNNAANNYSYYLQDYISLDNETRIKASCNNNLRS